MDSPLGDDSDHEADFSLTPRTEAKYNKIDEEFHLMMQRNQLNGGRVSICPALPSSQRHDMNFPGRRRSSAARFLHASHSPCQLQLQLQRVSAHLSPTVSVPEASLSRDVGGRQQRLPGRALSLSLSLPAVYEEISHLARQHEQKLAGCDTPAVSRPATRTPPGPGHGNGLTHLR